MKHVAQVYQFLTTILGPHGQQGATANDHGRSVFVCLFCFHLLFCSPHGRGRSLTFGKKAGFGFRAPQRLQNKYSSRTSSHLSSKWRFSIRSHLCPTRRHKKDDGAEQVPSANERDFRFDLVADFRVFFLFIKSVLFIRSRHISGVRQRS